MRRIYGFLLNPSQVISLLSVARWLFGGATDQVVVAVLFEGPNGLFVGLGVFIGRGVGATQSRLHRPNKTH